MAVPLDNLLAFLGPRMHPPADRTEERIILASRKRFIEEGFAKITVGELCQTLRVSKKTFYKYFRDKEDLVMAVVASNFMVFQPKLAEIFSAGGPPDERYDRFMDFFINTVAKVMSVAFLADMQTLIPDLWDAVDAFRMTMVGRVLDLIREGQEAGIYRSDIDPEKLSRVVLLFVSKVVDPKTLFEHGLPLSDAAGTFMDVMRYGIYEKPRKRRSRK